MLTRLRLFASGGRVPHGSDDFSSLRVFIECEVGKKKHEIAEFWQNLLEYELQDEIVQPSRREELAASLVEPVDGRYEIPVPLKNEIVEELPNNYESALKRTSPTRCKALRVSNLERILITAFGELIDKKWIVPVNSSIVCDVAWYLLFFVTKTEKPRVAYDGAAKVDGKSVNQAVLAGGNLLNNFLQVLLRFRLGSYVFVADVSKCFFQVSILNN